MTRRQPVALRERSVLPFDELEHYSARAFTIGDDDWPFAGFVVRDGDVVHAYVNCCPHQKHPLNMGSDDFLTEDLQLIRCASHGALFEKDSGACVAGPCSGKYLKKLLCRVENNDVLVTAPDSMRDFEELQSSGKI
jgi:nitrite reductase/ring-hydroxylating ferredoxin subunit